MQENTFYAREHSNTRGRNLTLNPKLLNPKPQTPKPQAPKPQAPKPQTPNSRNAC